MTILLRVKNFFKSTPIKKTLLPLTLCSIPALTGCAIAGQSLTAQDLIGDFDSGRLKEFKTQLGGGMCEFLLVDRRPGKYLSSLPPEMQSSQPLFILNLPCDTPYSERRAKQRDSMATVVFAAKMGKLFTFGFTDSTTGFRLRKAGGILLNDFLAAGYFANGVFVGQTKQAAAAPAPAKAGVPAPKARISAPAAKGL
ncbi:MAG: hypothetical protein AB7E52_00605 [Bdellovibrionales bacterium]